MSTYLAVDTATEACSAALWRDGQVTERFAVEERAHTRLLLPMIRGLLADAGVAMSDLDGIVCGIGPGSFAGVRIGVGVAKGIALARDLPVAGVSSLAMLAARAIGQGAGSVACAIDARMSQVYFGAYRAVDGRPERVEPEKVCAPAAVPRLPASSQWTAVGTGWGPHAVALRAATGIEPVLSDAAALPHAAEALALGVPELQAGRGIGADALVPAYLRDEVALKLSEQAALRRK